MQSVNLEELAVRLDSLAVFRGLLSDPVMDVLCDYLRKPSVSAYGELASKVFETPSGTLAGHILDICENSENVYVRTIGSNNKVTDAITECVKEELQTLQNVAELTTEVLREPLEWQGFLPELANYEVNIAEAYAYRVNNIGRYGYGIYAKNRMFYIDEEGSIIPVIHPDKTSLSDLVDYESERQIIINNTRALLAGKPAANILLTGDAGTGKSSTVKAVGNELFSDGLRIIEVRKDQLKSIPQVLDSLATNPLKFVLFIDDLSFMDEDDNFNALKAVLEGSVSAKSPNVVIYATSNRRHIIREKFSDRECDEVHFNDSMQEIVSLSERFGIHVTFQKPDKKCFLHIVNELAKARGITMPEDELALKAERFALSRGSRSARLAKQFVDELSSSLE